MSRNSWAFGTAGMSFHCVWTLVGGIVSCGGRRRRGVCLVWYIADRGEKKFGIQNLVGGSGRLLSDAIEISQHPSHV